MLYLVPYICYKVIKRTKVRSSCWRTLTIQMVNPAEADLTSNIINPWDITEEPEPKTWYGKVWRAITQ